MPYQPIEKLPELVKEFMPTNAEKFLEICQKWLNKEVPKNGVDKSVACSAVMCFLIRQVKPDFPFTADTQVLFNNLKKLPEFEATLTPKAGSIIVTPRVGDISGHTGAFITLTQIASNNSDTGVFHGNYTWPDGWMGKFGPKGRGLPHTIIFNWK